MLFVCLSKNQLSYVGNSSAENCISWSCYWPIWVIWRQRLGNSCHYYYLSPMQRKTTCQLSCIVVFFPTTPKSTQRWVRFCVCHLLPAQTWIHAYDTLKFHTGLHWHHVVIGEENGALVFCTVQQLALCFSPCGCHSHHSWPKNIENGLNCM